MLPPLGKALDDFVKAEVDKRGRITEEVVEAVLGNGQILIKGQRVSTTGEAVVREGQRIPVAWKANVPIVAYAGTGLHAQFAPVGGGPEGARIEELLLLKVGGVWDVWFRDDGFFVPLGLSAHVHHDRTVAPELETEPLAVKWGEGKDTFAVLTARLATFTIEGVDEPVSQYVPRFYIFRTNRKRDSLSAAAPTAELIETLSPAPIPSGYFATADTLGPIGTGIVQPSLVPKMFEQGGIVDSAGQHQSHGGGNRLADFILTKSLNVLLLITAAAETWVEVVGATTIQTREAVLVWSARTNRQVASLASVNGLAPDVGAPTPLGVEGSFVDTAWHTFMTQLAFVAWDETTPEKQVIFAEIRDIQSTRTVLGTGLGTQYTQANRRLFWLVSGNGTVRPAIADQTSSFDIIIAPDSEDPVPRIPDESAGISQEVRLASSPNTLFFILGLTSDSYLLASRVTLKLLDPVEFIYADDTEQLGVIKVSDGRFYPTGAIVTLTTDPLTALATNSVRQAQLYFRLLGGDILYSVAEGQSAVPTSQTDATADPTVPIAAQRDRFNQLTTGPSRTPSAVFYPPGGLQAGNSKGVRKMKPWLTALPSTETASESASEAVLARSVPRTSYRVVSG